MKKTIDLIELGEKSRTLIKDSERNEELSCPAPQPQIDDNKSAILFIGMNPAGDEKDAKRDVKTDGLYLNYYNDLEPLIKNGWASDSENRLIHKHYFNPILEFFKEITNEELIAWEWCNCDFKSLIEKIEKIRTIENCEKDILKKCQDKYSKAKYQIIIRDLVYYHQTSKFNTILKPKDDVKETVKYMLDEYIDMFTNDNLKLIYISTATTCKYIESALTSDKSVVMEDFGGFYYKGIPLILAGRPLNGTGVIDRYSRRRLVKTTAELLEGR